MTFFEVSVWVLFIIGFLFGGRWAYRKGYIKPKTWSWKWYLALALILLFSRPLWWLTRATIAAPAYTFAGVPAHKFNLWDPPAPPDPEAEAKAEAQAEEAEKMGSLRKCISADATVTDFELAGERILTANHSPTLVFAGVWPPYVGNVQGKASGIGRLPANAQYYLVEADMGGPLPVEELDSHVNPPPQMTSVIRLGELAKVSYEGTLGTNKGPGLCVWYIQSTVTGVEQKLRSSMTIPDEDQTELLEVEVGRKEVLLDLPSFGFQWVWWTPILWDTAYHSGIGDDLVPVGGVSEADWQQKYSQMKPPAGGKKATKVFKHLPYQALTVRLGDKPVKVPEGYEVLSATKGKGGEIRFQLNADPEDLLAGVCKPVKILIGCRKFSTSTWGFTAGK